ncbi:MAG: ABC transporter permease subunit [Planctomycetota bacterium]
MNRLLAIIKNSYLQTVRQPVYAIIVLVTLGGLGLAPSITGWTLDDDNKMLRDIGLSTLLIQGLFLACFAASNVFNTEIEDKTVLTVIAKPVNRCVFVLGKYLGVLAALLTAHYLAGIALFMTLRHGVLQTAAETHDTTVLVFGPGVMLLILIAAGVINYLYDKRFLITVLLLAIPAGTISTGILLVIDRNWKLQSFEVTQTMDDLPPEAIEPDSFKGIVEFRPIEGDRQIKGHRGFLVRRTWQGPINDADRQYLLDLSDSLQWKRDVNFLVQESRKLQGTEVFKAAILLIAALAIMAGVAVAASTRLGVIATFLISLLAISAGLAADQVLRPLAEEGAAWARVLYPFVPNFQCFWMIDALSDNRIIPWSYVASAGGYGLVYAAGLLLLGMALFETREVG